jgi:hypothetical protein
MVISVHSEWSIRPFFGPSHSARILKVSAMRQHVARDRSPRALCYLAPVVGFSSSSPTTREAPRRAPVSATRRLRRSSRDHLLFPGEVEPFAQRVDLVVREPLVVLEVAGEHLAQVLVQAVDLPVAQAGQHRGDLAVGQFNSHLSPPGRQGRRSLRPRRSPAECP